MFHACVVCVFVVRVFFVLLFFIKCWVVCCIVCVSAECVFHVCFVYVLVYVFCGSRCFIRSYFTLFDLLLSVCFIVAL